MADMAPSAQGVDLGILLALAYQEFIRELRSDLADQGFSAHGRSDGYVLRALGSRPMTISELAVRLDISKQGAAQIVDDMAGRGLVERRPDPTDGRARLVHLTSSGEEVLAAARRFHRRYERRLSREHGPDGVAVLRGMLVAIAGVDNTDEPRLRALYV